MSWSNGLGNREELNRSAGKIPMFDRAKTGESVAGEHTEYMTRSSVNHGPSDDMSRSMVLSQAHKYFRTVCQIASRQGRRQHATIEGCVATFTYLPFAWPYVLVRKEPPSKSERVQQLPAAKYSSCLNDLNKPSIEYFTYDLSKLTYTLVAESTSPVKIEQDRPFAI